MLPFWLNGPKVWTACCRTGLPQGNRPGWTPAELRSDLAGLHCLPLLASAALRFCGVRGHTLTFPLLSLNFISDCFGSDPSLSLLVLVPLTSSEPLSSFSSHHPNLPVRHGASGTTDRPGRRALPDLQQQNRHPGSRGAAGPPATPDGVFI